MSAAKIDRNAKRNAGRSAKSVPQLSIRIDLDGDGRIGPGKIELLEQIRSQGSISAAGRAMNMSYKRAWDLVDEITRICGRDVVRRQTGGKDGGGASLTPLGASVVERYRRIEKAALDAARADLIGLRSEISSPRKANRR